MARILGQSGDKKIAEFQDLQSEMVQLSQEYSRERLAIWSREMEEMAESWGRFQRGWEDTLNHMGERAIGTFELIAGSWEDAGHLLSQSWKRNLTEMTEELASWAEAVQKVLREVNQAWGGFDGQGDGGGWSSWLGLGLDFGGWFHQGGVVEAHQGMVVGPERLLGEEQLVMVQTGEGILPRDSMLRLGNDNFEALRRGQFDFNSGAKESSVHINITVQTLDASGVANLDWSRLMNRQLLPALQKELGRRW